MANRLSSLSLDDSKASGNKKQILLRLLKYMAGYRVITFFAILFTIITNMLALYSPRISGYVIDLIEDNSQGIDFGMVYYYCAVMVIFYLLSAIFQYLLRRIMVNLSQSMIAKLREDSFAKLAKLKVSYFDTKSTGDIISRFSYDAETVGTSVCQDIITISTAFITAIFSVVMMLIISPLLSIILVATIPVSAFVATTISKKIRPLFREKSRKLGELNGYLEEMISCYRSIKVYHQQQRILGEFDKKNNEVIETHVKAEYASTSIAPATSFVNNLSLALICTGGSILYLFEKITLGDVSSFILYSRKFSSVISEVSRITSELQTALACAERIFSFLDENEEENPSTPLESIASEYAISLQSLDFGYDESTKILHNINLNVKQGQTIAIVGQTGSGKTTLINLLMRFYDHKHGKILMNGQDILLCSRESIRNEIGMVLQESWLFNGTFRENITYANPTASMDDVIKVAEATYIHSYISSLEKGYDTVINENGSSLSEGQKQLLMIARIMLADKKYLILDEATSSVDTITEIEIQNAMAAMMKNRTCFVIAHRLSTIQNADMILVMKNGRVIESGTHSELLEHNGEYYSLYHAQFYS